MLEIMQSTGQVRRLIKVVMFCIFYVAVSSILGCGGAEPFEDPPKLLAEAPRLDPKPMGISDAEKVIDPSVGEKLFQLAPATGLLACYDCHSENPIARNFGNIWAGRNSPEIIERAINLNTGGMGYLSRYFGSVEIKQIAAYLGISPFEIQFDLLESARQTKRLNVFASTKAELSSLAWQMVGNFTVVSTTCQQRLERFATCVFEVQPSGNEKTAQQGELLLTLASFDRPVRIKLSAN